MKETRALQTILTKKFGTRERRAIFRWKEINEMGGFCYLICLEGSPADLFTQNYYQERKLCSPRYPGYFNKK